MKERTEKMEEKTSKREFQDTEEMEEHQSGRSEKSVAKVVQKNHEEESVEKWEVEERKRAAHKGRCDPLEWRLGQRVQQYQPRKWCEDCWARLVSWFTEDNLQPRKSMHEIKNRRGGDEATAKDEDHVR